MKYAYVGNRGGSTVFRTATDAYHRWGQIGRVMAINPRRERRRMVNDGWQARLAEYPGIVGEGKTRDQAVDDVYKQASGEIPIAADRQPPERRVRGPRPTIVCLCGSCRFWREFQAASLRETLAGRIVLSIGAATGTDDEHFGNLPPEEYDRIKAQLDALHLRKIDLADEVLILNVGGYIGQSTRNELDYARVAGKTIRFLEEPQ